MIIIVPAKLTGTIIPAASASRADVGAAYADAAEGDTITIPAGTESWTNTLFVTKAVTIQGAGIGQTIILDDIIKVPNQADTEAFLILDTTTNKFYRLSGIEFRIGTRTAGSYINGSVQVRGQSHSIRIDNCKFDRLLNAGVYIYGGTLGVIDNCKWNLTTRHTIATKNHQLYGLSYGRGSWETPLTPGSSQMWYYEDNTFTGDDSDSFGGGRACWRFNTFTNSLIHTHGTESTGLYRGCRWTEIYGNTMYHTTTDTRNFVDFRDGGGLIASNTIVDTGSAFQIIQYNNYRMNGPYVWWGGADGTNPLDLNDTAGGIYDTGICTTATSGSGVSLRTLIDTNKNWTIDQWAGYTLRNMSSNYQSFVSNIPYTSNFFSQIVNNTATTITYRDHATSLKMRFAAGNSYEIRRVILALDQPGSGTSDPWDPHDTNNARWLNQPREPIYQWENRVNGVLVTVPPGYGNIIEGRDYSNNVAHPTWTPYTYPHPLRSGDTNVPPSPPSAPTSLVATKISSSQIDLSWTNTAGTNAELVRIERSLTGGGVGFSQIDTVDATESTYSNFSLAPNTTYYYRIRASNGAGFSAYTSEANATTDAIINPSTIKGRRIGGLTRLIGQ